MRAFSKVVPVLVLDGHPAYHVDLIALVPGHNAVVRFPAHSAGDVAQLRVEFAGLVRLEDPVKRRFENGVIPQRWEQRLAGQAETQLAVDLDDGLAGRLIRVAVLSRHVQIFVGVARPALVPAAYDLATNDLVAAAFFLDEKLDLIAFIQGQEQSLRDRIGPIVLLEDPDGVLTLRIPQDHGVRLQVGGDVCHAHLVDARRQVERQRSAHHGKILVVDRQGRLGRRNADKAQ